MVDATFEQLGPGQVLTAHAFAPTEYAPVHRNEQINPLTSPVLVLVQSPHPGLFAESNTKGDYLNEELSVPLTQYTAHQLERVVYEPYLIVPEKSDDARLRTFLESEKVEQHGTFGPFRVYRFVEHFPSDETRSLAYPSRAIASRKIAGVMPDDLHVLSPDIDKIPKTSETNERYFRGVNRHERQRMRNEMETLFETHFLTPLTLCQDIQKYPEVMFKSLETITTTLFDAAPKDYEGRIITSPSEPNWLKWYFAEQYIMPLQQYLEYQLTRVPTAPHLDSTADIAAKVIDYDFVIDTMRGQADLLIGQQIEPRHFGFLIPNTAIDGAQSGEVKLHWNSSYITIQRGDETWKFPVPEKNTRDEVAIKGGVARLVAKICLGLPVMDELPPHDLDLVTFGSTSAFGMEHLKQKYDADPRDIERIPTGGINKYLGDRDQSINEVLLTDAGLVMSPNALSTYFQRTTEASADPVRTIHGEHVLNVHRGYSDEGADAADFWLVRGARFPSPRALARMYKFLIEDKVDSVTIPRGTLKMDIGHAHWLVLARKLLHTPDPKRRDHLLHRMVRLAGSVNSPYFRDEFLDDKSGPYRFITSIATQFEKDMGKPFDMKGDLSDKETLDWIAGRLVRQIIGRFDRYFGRQKEKSFADKMTTRDLEPIQLVLIDKKDQSDLIVDSSLPLHAPETEEPFDRRVVDIDAILKNELYQMLFARHEKRNQELNISDGLTAKEKKELRKRIHAEADTDEKTFLTTDRQRREYNQWFIKYKYLEQVRDDLDPGMYPVLYQFNRLPFSSHSSDTGHIIPDTNRIENDWLPALNFIAYPDVTLVEQEVQRHFIEGIPTLNTRICDRLGVTHYNILDLRGYLEELPDGSIQELSVQETFEKGLEFTLYLNVPNYNLSHSMGRETLTAVWEEFYRYTNEFLDQKGEALDLQQGDIFVRRSKVRDLPPFPIVE